MITHRLSLAEAGLGFQLTASGQDSIKVIIDPLLRSEDWNLECKQPKTETQTGGTDLVIPNSFRALSKKL